MTDCGLETGQLNVETGRALYLQQRLSFASK